MEVVNYWNRGGRLPVWFVADPLRSDLALIDHEAPAAVSSGRSSFRCSSAASGRTSWTGA
jgi:hypothetical protein